MKQYKLMTRMAATAAVGAMALTGCAGTGEDEAAQPTQTQTQSASSTPTSGSSSGAHEHAPHGGPPPQGIEKADNPTYPVGTQVILTADHMPGMKGSEATISGAFDTTAYSVTYTPTNGGEPVTNHKWVVHEELKNPAQAPLPEGTEVTLQAEHMSGMKGAKATIEGSTDETVYMVDLKINGMKMTNHKWVVESEIKPAQ
ncbi:YdhK family protein [Arthrobacter castelli]|uniref:YdhK family protein n=1 Tax=Arthrobacter castelli TaxID=271431 RepID=UPI0004285BEA|nr:YdhK family protein [Arthrobacter castelli]